MYGGIEGALQGLAPVHKKGLQQTGCCNTAAAAYSCCQACKFDLNLLEKFTYKFTGKLIPVISSFQRPKLNIKKKVKI